MPTLPTGVFAYTIPSADLAKGLRPSKRSPRNTKFLTICEGAVGLDNVLQGLAELEDSRIDTAIIADPLPHPQIFVFSRTILVLGLTDIYEYVAGALVHCLTVPAGIPWSVIDCFDYIYASNGVVAVRRRASDHVWEVTTGLPIATGICNFNGQVLVFGSENILYTTHAPTTAPPTSPPTTLGPTTIAPTSLPPTTLAPTTTATSAPPTTPGPTTAGPSTAPPTTAPPQNDFSLDRFCKALWRFESGALTVDSKGSNDLTNLHTVTENTVDFQEGACCASFDKFNTEMFEITDGALDPWYPLKIGDDRKTFSICGWFKMDTIVDGMAIYSKWQANNGKSVIPLRITSYGFESLIGYNSGVSTETLYQGGSPQVGRWYHFGYTHNGLNRQWRLKIWDDTAAAVVVDVSGIAAHYISLSNCAVSIGLGLRQDGDVLYFWDGLIDEVVVFNDILDESEIDDIRQGLYSHVSTSGPPTTMGPTTVVPTTIVPTTLYPTTAP